MKKQERIPHTQEAKKKKKKKKIQQKKGSLKDQNYYKYVQRTEKKIERREITVTLSH